MSSLELIANSPGTSPGGVSGVSDFGIQPPAGAMGRVEASRGWVTVRLLGDGDVSKTGRLLRQSDVNPGHTARRAP
jgi:hypothetical protein